MNKFLLTDPKNGKKSITMTLMVSSFVMSVFVIVYIAINHPEHLATACTGATWFMAPNYATYFGRKWSDNMGKVGEVMKPKE